MISTSESVEQLGALLASVTGHILRLMSRPALVVKTVTDS